MKDLIGKKSSELTIVSISERKGKGNETYVWCLCSCSKETEVRLNNFNEGRVQSCGCKKSNAARKTGFAFSISNSPSEKARVSAEQKVIGRTRRSIEDIQEGFRLKRELNELSYAM